MFKNGEYCCSFCKKHQDDVEVIIASGDVGICDNCTKISMELINDYFEAKEQGKYREFMEEHK